MRYAHATRTAVSGQRSAVSGQLSAWNRLRRFHFTQIQQMVTFLIQNLTSNF
ncbi:hypothetical protein [Moorena sp. SIO3I6]|uniref:hypothetical protein n=1 Tax=Moorena sp. SIO3I6 TaxID=2607831 RepID=UPI0013F9E20F|nr:hypothetical protein [Moorena sp. SIO3I6]NEP21532.1 hypothetical protein [Moorena sp. SIO3I6]